MQVATRVARKLGLMLIALLSVGAGAVALWGGLSPETFGSARTVDLLIVLGLLLLPAATFIAVVAERRTRCGSPRAGSEIDTDAPIDWLGPSQGGASPSEGEGLGGTRHENGSPSPRAKGNRHRPPVATRRPTSATRP